MCYYQIPLNITHKIHYSVITTYESNISLPVTRQYFRMMCDNDILQLFSEDLN